MAIRGAPAKGIGRLHGAWVQIPPSPPVLNRLKYELKDKPARRVAGFLLH